MIYANTIQWTFIRKTVILEVGTTFVDYNFSFGIISSFFYYHNCFIEVLAGDESKIFLRAWLL